MFETGDFRGSFTVSERRNETEIGCQEIAFPAISTGIYGYPKEEAAHIAYEAVKRFLDGGHDMKVVFVFHNADDEISFRNAIGFK